MISFRGVRRGASYSRHELAERWGYESFHAIARGVVTPKGDNKIVLFVTEEKQRSSVPYDNRLRGSILAWEGPTDHFAEDRILASKVTGEELHIFHRLRHHSDFQYCGTATLIGYKRHGDRLSRFRFALRTRTPS